MKIASEKERFLTEMQRRSQVRLWSFFSTLMYNFETSSLLKYHSHIPPPQFSFLSQGHDSAEHATINIRREHVALAIGLVCRY